MKQSLIAPCGMNCGICYAYLREKNKCPGCRSFNSREPVSIAGCRIRNCERIKNKTLKYCSDKCNKFPCQRLKSLDKRYRAKYMMSMLENLEYIREKGIRKFINNEKQRWIKDGKTFCVHHKRYYGNKNN